jgi:hypothetical protein
LASVGEPLDPSGLVHPALRRPIATEGVPMPAFGGGAERPDRQVSPRGARSPADNTRVVRRGDLPGRPPAVGHPNRQKCFTWNHSCFTWNKPKTPETRGRLTFRPLAVAQAGRQNRMIPLAAAQGLDQGRWGTKSRARPVTLRDLVEDAEPCQPLPWVGRARAAPAVGRNECST